MNGIIGMTELALDTRADRRAARLSRDRQRLGRLAADDPQRHSRLLEDRVAQARARSRCRSRSRDAGGESLKPLALRADQKGLELICDIDPDVPARRRRRPGALAQVLDQPRRQRDQVHGIRPRPRRRSARSVATGRHARRCTSGSPTPASASRPRSTPRSSKPSARPMDRRPAGSAARGWG